jgi:hypothetical protein
VGGVVIRILSWNCIANKSGADELLGMLECSIWLDPGGGKRYIGDAGGPRAGDGIMGGISEL